MLRFALTALLFVGGLFFIIWGFAFLVRPDSMVGGFGLAPSGPQGWATVRADMTALFVTTGACMMIGAWRRAGDVLLVPAMLFGIALVGRLVGAAVDGTYDNYWFPMLVEGAVVVVSLLGHKLLPHHRMEEITG